MAASEQQRLLAEHKDVVKAEALLMRRAIDKGDLKLVLNHAKLLLEELRTGSLTPKLYYELSLDACDHLVTLEAYFGTLAASGTPMRDVYEAVAHAEHVIPRLYLLITAASTYVKCGQAGARAILAELRDAVAGVQHPMRGLFVRHFLVNRLKDKLPDSPLPPAFTLSNALPPPVEAGGATSSHREASAAGGVADDATSSGSVRDSVAFLLGVLADMNRLWVRLGAIGGGMGILSGNPVVVTGAENVITEVGGKGRKRRERERLELRVLVGSALTRLASLEHLDLPLYAHAVLPRLLGEVGACRDRLAQAYLFDSLLQVFPLEWHVWTLEHLLCALRDLVPDPGTVRVILQGIFSRLREGALAAAAASGEGSGGPSLLLTPPPVGSIPPPPISLASLLSSKGHRAQSTPLTRPSVTPPGLPPSLDVFTLLLTHINALGMLPPGQGPFRGAPAPGSAPPPAAAVATAAPPSGSSSVSGDGAAVAVSAPVTVTGGAEKMAPPSPPSKPSLTDDTAGGGVSSSTAASLRPMGHSARAATIASAQLRALRDTTAVAGALEGIAAHLDVYSSFLSWTLATYGPHAPYIDAILHGAAGFLHDVMGLPQHDGGNGGLTATIAAVAAASAASTSSKGGGSPPTLPPSTARALLSSLLAGDGRAPLPGLEGGGRGGVGSQPVSPATTTTPLSSASALHALTSRFTLPPSSRPRLFLDAPSSTTLASLLSDAQTALGLGILTLDAYAPAMAPLAGPFKRNLAAALLNAVLDSRTRLSDASTAAHLLSALAPLIRDEETTVPPPITSSSAPPALAPASAAPAPAVAVGGSGGGGGGTGSPPGSPGSSPRPLSPAAEESSRFRTEQMAMGRLVLLLGSVDPSQPPSPSDTPYALDTDFSILSSARDALAGGGPRCIAFTFPPVVTSALALARRAAALTKRGVGSSFATTTHRVFALVHDTALALAVGGHGEAALALFLQAAQDSATESEAAHELLCQAFLLFEELPSSKSQANLFPTLVAAIGGARALSSDRYAALASRAGVVASRSLRKRDAVVALLGVARLYWRPSALGAPPPPHARIATEAQSFLTAALRAADAAPPREAPHLFALCLSGYCDALEAAAPFVTAAHVGDLLALCDSYAAWWLEGAKGGGEAEGVLDPSPALLGLRERIERGGWGSGGGGKGGALKTVDSGGDEL